MELSIIQWPVTILVPFLFAIWSFSFNPAQFSNATAATFALIGANVGGYTKVIGTSLAALLYIIFDPFWIIIDDLVVGGIAIYAVRRILAGLVKKNFPFPTPWKLNPTRRVFSILLVLGWIISVITLLF